MVKKSQRSKGLIVLILVLTVFPVILGASWLWIVFHVAVIALIASTSLVQQGHRRAIPVITIQSLIILILMMSLENRNEQFIMLFNGSMFHLVLSNLPTNGHWKRFVGMYLLLAYLFGIALTFMGIRIPISGLVIGFPRWFEQFTPLFIFLVAAIYMHLLGDIYESDLIKWKLKNEGQFHHETELDRIEKAADNAEEIVNRLLRISAVQSQATWQSSSLTERLRKTYPSIQIKDANPNQRFNPKTRIALQLAMECFIDNAIAYGQPPITVEIDTRGYIKICDCGKGLSPEQLENYGKDNPLLDLSKPLHGVGVSFSIKILQSIGWTVSANNTAQGFEISLRPVEGSEN